MHRVELKRDFRAPYAKILKNRTLDKRGVAAVIEERVTVTSVTGLALWCRTTGTIMEVVTLLVEPQTLALAFADSFVFVSLARSVAGLLAGLLVLLV